MFKNIKNILFVTYLLLEIQIEIGKIKIDFSDGYFIKYNLLIYIYNV